MAYRYLTPSSLFAPRGFVNARLVYAPAYSAWTGPVEHNVVFIDEANRLFFRRADRKFVWRVDSIDVESAAVEFLATQKIEVTIIHVDSHTTLEIALATVGNGQTVGTLNPPVPIVMPLNVGIIEGDDNGELVALDVDLDKFRNVADARVLSQMDDDAAANKRNFRDFIEVLTAQQARYYDVCHAVRAGFERETAIGAQLDLLGAVAGLPREGATDERYRELLSIQVELLLAVAREGAEWTGTSENILRIARAFVGAGPTITLNNGGVYAFMLTIASVKLIAEADKLARFITTAIYAGVAGIIAIALGAQSVWGSSAVSVTGAGQWGSSAVAVTLKTTWGTVVTTD